MDLMLRLFSAAKSALHWSQHIELGVHELSMEFLLGGCTWHFGSCWVDKLTS